MGFDQWDDEGKVTAEEATHADGLKHAISASFAVVDAAQTDADSHAAPRHDPRARRDLGAARDALRRNGVRGKCEVLGAGSCLYVHRPCVELLPLSIDHSYTKSFR